MDVQLWLMRHGEAEDADRAGSDFARSLTDRGRQQVEDAARWLRERVEPPDLILHSPLRRAHETAVAFGSAWDGAAPVEENGWLAPGLRARQLVQLLDNCGALRIVCVGHQPDVGACLSELLGGGRFRVAPGSVAAVAFSGPPTPGTASLQWYLDPAWFGG